MKGVSEFIKTPGANDIPIGKIFTEQMLNEMIDLMSQAGWSGLEETKAQYHNNYKEKKIISEFIRDDLIGKKRLTSMPDRLTNTIETSSGETVLRPTVINCYSEPLNSVDIWWKNWKSFMFVDSISLVSKSKTVQKVKMTDIIQPIKRSKYPAITEEEELISKPLQIMALGIFDAILVHMMNTIDQQVISDSGSTSHLKGAASSWPKIRNTICDKLNKNKNSRILEILTSSVYSSTDILFLQEVGKTFLSTAAKHERFNELYDLFTSQDTTASSSTRDQNSVILLKKNKYELVKEVTGEVTKGYETIPRDASFTGSKSLPVDEGDLLAILVQEKNPSSSSSSSTPSGGYLLASFHGDTNGLATKAVVEAMNHFALYSAPNSRLLFGLDANTYSKPEKDQQGVLDFATFYSSLHINSCYTQHPDIHNYTTFHARTYLQPQLNKAITFEEKDEKGDKNLKDHILFYESDYELLETKKDNTGDKRYVEGMVFPTLQFPSDHGITSAVLRERTQAQGQDRDKGKGKK
jgi:hypothetical protein